MRLFWTFVLVGVFSTTLVGYAQASEDRNMKNQQSANLSNEGFSINYSDEELGSLQYDSTLAYWKKKQAALWENLNTNPFTMNASAYTAAADECGNDKGITASGIKVEARRTLACPPEYPFGTKIEIESMGTFVCEDRGGAIKGNHFDIYMEKKSEAFAFGRKNLIAKVILE